MLHNILISLFSLQILQVIAKLEGPAVSQYCACKYVRNRISYAFLLFLSSISFSLKLISRRLNSLQATLDESFYELAGELVVFLALRGTIAMMPKSRMMQ